MTPRLAAMIVTPILLTGCIGGLIGGGKPDTLYRFGVQAPATGLEAAGPVAITPAQQRTVLLPLPLFAPAVAGDRILTSQGGEVSYIKLARWVTGAPILYQASLAAMIRSRAPDIAVSDRLPVTPPQYRVRIEIDRFEAVYEAGPKAAPTIHIDGRAVLVGKDLKAPATYPISVTQPATANQISAITAAFGTAVSQSTLGIADWISLTARPTAPAPH